MSVLEEARLAAAEGRPARAAEICAAALKAGTDAQLLEALVTYLEQAGFEHEALEKLYDLHRIDPSVCRRLVDLALKVGRPDVAAPHLKDYDYLKDSVVPNEQFGYAYLLYYNRRYREAAPRFLKLTRLPEWRIWAHNLAGLCYYYLDQPEPSLDQFRMALQLTPQEDRFEYREVHFNRACVLYVNRQFRATLASLERLWSLDPDYPQLREWLDEVRIRLRGDDDGPLRGAGLIPRPGPPQFRHRRRFEAG